MDWAELRDLVEHHAGGVDVSVELYTRRAVRSGQVTCPTGSRLSDLLNGSVTGENPGRVAFLGFLPAGGASDFDRGTGSLREYVRKSAIDLVAVADQGAGQVTAGPAGADGEGGRRYREKSPVRITLDVGSYTIMGDMHRASGETVEDVLNADALFLPLTRVIMVRDNLLYGARPFIAVNKAEVVSCRQDGSG